MFASFSYSGIDASLIFLDELESKNKYRKKFLSVKDNENNMDTGGLILCNPRIIARSPEIEMRVWTEECLVLPPKFTATLLRDNTILVQYENLEGITKNKFLSGELARALQHEMDHDRGILIVDHVNLDDLETIAMKEIERLGHDDRMEIAYSRYLDFPAKDVTQTSLLDRFIEPVHASEPSMSPTQSKQNSSSNNDCDEKCMARRKQVIEERRALMKQSQSSTSRRQVLELSRQRAALYETPYRGL